MAQQHDGDIAVMDLFRKAIDEEIDKIVGRQRKAFALKSFCELLNKLNIIKLNAFSITRMEHHSHWEEQGYPDADYHVTIGIWVDDSRVEAKDFYI